MPGRPGGHLAGRLSARRPRWRAKVVAATGDQPCGGGADGENPDRAGDEGIRPSRLAHQVVFSRSRLTHTMKRLESRGLIERRPCEGDGRGGLVSLTQAGKTLFDEAALVQRAVIRRLFLDDITPEEIDMLTGLFTRVSERLDSDTPCP